MPTILRCAKDHKALGLLTVVLLLVAMVLPYLGAQLALVERQIVDKVVLTGQLDLLPKALGMYAVLWLIMTSGLFVSAPLRTYLNETLMSRYRQRLLEHCGALAFSHREHTGQTVSLLSNDVPNVAHLLSTSVLGGFGCLAAIITGFVVMLQLNWQLALAAGLMPPLVAGLASRVTRPLRPLSHRTQEKAGELTERMQEELTGIREIVAFGQEQSRGRRFAAIMNELLQLRVRQTVAETTIGMGQSFVSLAITLIIMGYGSYLVLNKQATLGTLIAIRPLFGMVFQPAGQILTFAVTIQKELASAERLYSFLDETPLVTEKRTAQTPRQVAGTVTFEQVSFGYHPGQEVLRDVSFTARPGEMVALVGPSGAGKTTLASLIARFYDPASGRILLDDLDLRDLTLSGIRQQIGIVFQDSFLFSASIRENIAVGREGATDEEIIAAARAAHAWEFIAALPNGLDSQVGERGTYLSEGQKQRIAIARAFLRNPQILILDEPTSALDARSEHLLEAALMELTRGRTTFVIAHRLQTVRRANRILVLESGNLVEQGTHAELIGAGGLYSELCRLQFGEDAFSQGHNMTEGDLRGPSLLSR